MAPRQFPVMEPERWKTVGVMPRRVPWKLVEPLRDSCMRFHDQTLEQLASRGGLSAEELYFHVHDGVRGVAWRERHKVSEDEAIEWLRSWGVAPTFPSRWRCEICKHLDAEETFVTSEGHRCPKCHDEDVFPHREFRCLVCGFTGNQHDFFGDCDADPEPEFSWPVPDHLRPTTKELCESKSWERIA